MASRSRSKAKAPRPVNTKALMSEIRAKRAWLMEAEATLLAIRQGEVDAVVVQEHEGEKLMALKSFDELAADNAELRTQIAERNRVESFLHVAQEELRALTARLLAAQDEERRRIARDLHDDIVQKMAALAIETESAAQRTAASPDVSRLFRSLHGRIVDVSTAVRNLAHGLHPAILTDLGLRIALQRYAQEFAHRTGIRCTVKVTHLSRALPVDLITCLYKIVLESLANVQRHAKADAVVIDLAKRDGWLLLSVRDNGKGFALGAEERGLGFVSMRERAYMVNGILTVQSCPGKGTTVRAEVPLS